MSWYFALLIAVKRTHINICTKFLLPFMVTSKLHGPQHEKMSLQTKFLISRKQVWFDRVMFLESNSFYLTGLFKVLCEIWRIYYMYPFDAIVMKNGAKVAHCISSCYCCSENSLFCWNSLNVRKKVLFYWQHINLTHNLPKVFYIFSWLRGCYGYNLVTNIGNLSLNRLKKGQITHNLKLFNVLEFVNLVI